jgi:hypothetical protein
MVGCSLADCLANALRLLSWLAWLRARCPVLLLWPLDTETDYAGAPEETHGDSGLLPAGGFAPSGAQLAWFEADLAKVR